MSNFQFTWFAVDCCWAQHWGMSRASPKHSRSAMSWHKTMVAGTANTLTSISTIIKFDLHQLSMFQAAATVHTVLSVALLLGHFHSSPGQPAVPPSDLSLAQIYLHTLTHRCDRYCSCQHLQTPLPCCTRSDCIEPKPSTCCSSPLHSCCHCVHLIQIKGCGMKLDLLWPRNVNKESKKYAPTAWYSPVNVPMLFVSQF